MCTSTPTSSEEADNNRTSTGVVADNENVPVALPAASEEAALINPKTAECEQQELCNLSGYRTLITWDE